MKKYFISLLLLMSVHVVLAQDEEVQRFREATDNSKSGNYKEVLSNLFQLGTSNLTGPNKSVEFNSTLYGIKSIFWDNITTDTVFSKQKFSRNFEFNTKLNFDEQFNYKGFSGGITYALINERDKDVANFKDTELYKNLQFLNNELSEIQIVLVNELIKTGDAELSAKIEAINIATSILINKEFDKIEELSKSNPYFGEILTEFENRNKSIKLKDYITKIHELRDKEYSDLEKKALWTVSLNGTTNDKGNNKKLTFGTVFLQGFKNLELDIRSNLIYSDTLIEKSVQRLELRNSAGLNYKMFKRNEQSVFEIKLYMEYNSILKNKLADEKRNTFLASSDFRIRVTKDIWIPLTIKYDIEKSNFLGFLNITYNFGKEDKDKLVLNE
ncbi:hypothetical protein [Flavobacterium sp. B183]|uniref:hypothetical protein n=1 Tax=Flavobacterium sp. B183 TaxID=907046 RepID=UPI00201F2B2A|nr:hypothetical protein [Flavobacterium sp. B183]URC12474.1 hypothetical protein M4I44_20675 [Flavobacterium sp. B183]